MLRITLDTCTPEIHTIGVLTIVDDGSSSTHKIGNYQAKMHGCPDTTVIGWDRSRNPWELVQAVLNALYPENLHNP